MLGTAAFRLIIAVGSILTVQCRDDGFDVVLNVMSLFLCSFFPRFDFVGYGGKWLLVSVLSFEICIGGIQRRPLHLTLHSGQ